MPNNFKPKPNFARDWARLAKRAGMKYMVLTSKHHEGFCNFDSKLTQLLRHQESAGTRSGARVCRGSASRRIEIWFLLFVDGLAPSRRRALCER